MYVCVCVLMESRSQSSSRSNSPSRRRRGSSGDHPSAATTAANPLTHLKEGAQQLKAGLAALSLGLARPPSARGAPRPGSARAPGGAAAGAPLRSSEDAERNLGRAHVSDHRGDRGDRADGASSWFARPRAPNPLHRVPLVLDEHALGLDRCVLHTLGAVLPSSGKCQGQRERKRPAGSGRAQPGAPPAAARGSPTYNVLWASSRV